MKRLMICTKISENTHFLDENALEQWRTDGSIENGDEVYEIKLLYVAHLKEEIYLVPVGNAKDETNNRTD